ncbi:MAG: diguanylate cyclase [Kiritimatiellae bacterium]|nr:diguanylate cyclase [Kiritimatiellia bacterium]
MPEWLIIVGQTAIVAVLAFLVFSAVTSHLRFQAMTRRARDAKSPAPGAQPAFELRIARQLGTAHRNPEPFTIARIAPAALPQLRELHGAGVVRDIFEKIEEHLKKSLRADDTTLRVNEDEVDVLIRSRRVAGESAVRRALHSLSSTPIKFSSGLSVRVDAIAGMASYPEDGDRAPDLYAKAGAALDAARSAGQGLHWPEGSAAAAPAEQRAEEGDAANVLDELTGVLRHDRIGTALQKFIAARRRDDLPVSVLLLDIDSLRRYNKQYGEKTGDALLRGLRAIFANKHARERPDCAVGRRSISRRAPLRPE